MTVVLKSKQRARSSRSQPETKPSVRPHLASFAPLDTPRLALVALSLEHAPAVFAYASHPEISRLRLQGDKANLRNVYLVMGYKGGVR